jgi:hypothetical protein
LATDLAKSESRATSMNRVAENHAYYAKKEKCSSHLFEYVYRRLVNQNVFYSTFIDKTIASCDTMFVYDNIYAKADMVWLKPSLRNDISFFII